MPTGRLLIAKSKQKLIFKTWLFLEIVEAENDGWRGALIFPDELQFQEGRDFTAVNYEQVGTAQDFYKSCCQRRTFGLYKNS